MFFSTHTHASASSNSCCDHHPVFSRHDSWLQRNQDLSVALGAGLLLLLGFAGEKFFAMAPADARIFYGAAMALGGFKLALHTVPTLLARRFDIEFLMLAGALGAAILGQWAEGAFLLFLFSLGHALEHHAMNRARNAISALGTLAPLTAHIRREGREIEIAVEEIRVGDLAVVRAGDRIGVDGIVRSGHSAVDQSPITGESVPVEKAPGDVVFAGTLNGDGALEIEVSRQASDSTLARVIELVEQAQAQKAPSQKFSERFERVFVPCVLAVVVFTAFVPPLMGWLSWNESFTRAISGMVAASPCALALATPSAILAAIGAGARSGVLFKGGAHLENLGQVSAVAFDKTGTLTWGQPEVEEIFATPNAGENEVLRWAAALERGSNHPLATAILRRAQGLEWPVGEEIHSVSGRGVTGEVEGVTARLGNALFLEENDIVVPDAVRAKITSWGEKGMPSMILARGSTVLGAFSLADAARPNASQALEKLRKLDVTELVMLTGDNALVARKIAPMVGATSFRAELLPAQKVEAIRELQRRWGKVAMVGDGTNDAPALAHADVGIAMGASASGLALETADVALMGNDLEKLAFAMQLSRKTRRIIAQNLWISLGVICLLVPSTLLGLTPLLVAVIFHEGSTIVVCVNALRLLAQRPAESANSLEIGDEVVGRRIENALEPHA